MTLNMAALDLLLDCQAFNFDTFPEGLVHQDGRPFTEEETRIVGQATKADLIAATNYQHVVIDHNREQLRLLDELATLTAPYFARYGKDATLGQLYPLMTPMDAATFSHIMDRLDRFA